MRKITAKIKQAFDRRESKTINNTRTDGTTVWLHGNAIVKREDDGVYVTLAGWNTPTTRERVNGITNIGFHQKNFEAYINNEPVSSTEWYKVQ
jgi:hypothetical protein|tara:strand:+ start:325 stop:603 length:279 start_codon:yes stop_codon:yes gene_type:complete